MKSSTTGEFRQRLGRLPVEVRRQAHRAYALWRSDPRHPGLQFKRVGGSQPVFSARVGLGFRALAYQTDEAVVWFWIGSHAEYDAFLAHL